MRAFSMCGRNPVSNTNAINVQIFDLVVEPANTSVAEMQTCSLLMEKIPLYTVGSQTYKLNQRDQ